MKTFIIHLESLEIEAKNRKEAVKLAIKQLEGVALIEDVEEL